MAASRQELLLDSREFGWDVRTDTPTRVVFKRGEQEIEVHFGPSGSIAWAQYWNGTTADRIKGGLLAVQKTMAMFGERI